MKAFTTAVLGGKWVQPFEDGDVTQRELLGGKGAGLAEMMKLGLPVPPGFTITTKASIEYLHDKEFPFGLEQQYRTAMKDLEKKTGKVLGDLKNPLLVSVRSGARVSMPGMMDTILNMGINDQVLETIAEQSGNRKFALNSYMTFIEGYGRSAKGMDKKFFVHIGKLHKDEYGDKPSVKDMDAMLQDYKDLYQAVTQEELPQDPQEQLQGAVKGVFQSWLSKRAIDYRNDHDIPHEWGTAVNVQAMVFGNMGEDSGTGVVFTVDKNTGEMGLYGDYLPNAQGEAVVSGSSNTMDIKQLEKKHPDLYKSLKTIMDTLFRHFRFAQDVEFTVEKGTLYILQTRNAKLPDSALLKHLCDLVVDGVLTKEEATAKLPKGSFISTAVTKFTDKAKKDATFLTKGINAVAGVAIGKAVFDPDTAEKLGSKESVILVRELTSPEDYHGMKKSKGILTATGGKTSHAAVVAGGENIPCVVGASDLKIDLAAKRFHVGKHTVEEGDIISLDGWTGEVYKGKLDTMTKVTTLEDLWKTCEVK